MVSIRIERLDKTIEAHEFTVRHRLRIIQDPDFDTSVNALLDTTDMTVEEIEELTERELDLFYDAVIENSYPGIREKLKNGELEMPSDEEKEDLKKN
jgi:hypothetical protein